MKTLYISDLDKTLLRSNERVSEYTANIISRFVKNGGYFSYATARNINSANVVTAGIDMKFPAICSDGVFVIDTATEKLYGTNYFSSEEVTVVREFLGFRKVSPIVFAYIDGKIRFSFIKEFITPETKFFLDKRIGDLRRREVSNIKELYFGDIYRFIWTPFSADKIYEEENFFKHFCRRDYEPQANLCDILPIKATKANAALQLKKMLGCDKIVVFGDNENDLSLFAVADEKYAVSNAIPKIKELATAVIDSNENDGVAKWIEKNIFESN